MKMENKIMNDWETIEKIVNTLPQWDVIKLIIGIQEELKCAKEDNLYQLRKNKDLQNQIDKAVENIKEKQKIQYKFALSRIECDELLQILEEKEVLE